TPAQAGAIASAAGEWPDTNAADADRGNRGRSNRGSPIHLRPNAECCGTRRTGGRPCGPACTHENYDGCRAVSATTAEPPGPCSRPSRSGGPRRSWRPWRGGRGPPISRPPRHARPRSARPSVKPANAVDLAHVLGNIETNRGNLHVDGSLT